MVFKNLLSNVDESVNESNSSDKGLTSLNELNENEVKHDPFECPHDDKIYFSRLLFDLII